MAALRSDGFSIWLLVVMQSEVMSVRVEDEMLLLYVHSLIETTNILGLSRANGCAAEQTLFKETRGRRRI